MTDLDRDEQLLVTTLHDRLAEVSPDLAGIAARATVAGARIRRRRRAGAGLAGAACAGLVLGGVFLLPGLGAGGSAPEAGSLGSPAAEPTPKVTRIQEPVSPVAQDLAFTIAVPDGWACEDPADDKLSCRVAGPDPMEAPGATLVQREASHHDEYLGMKGDGYAVRDLHRGYFVSVQPNPRAGAADMELLAGALTWDDGTPVF